MSSLNANKILANTSATAREKITGIEVFAEIDSTNSYLMQHPAAAPGKAKVAITDNQIAGRGRHGKTWESPAGSGLCLSVGYTFCDTPENLPAMTLAAGLAVVEALQELGVEGVELKWPNDLFANDGKLGGILSEVHHTTRSSAAVVVGVGINVALPANQNIGNDSEWDRPVVDLAALMDEAPAMDLLAGKMITHLVYAFANYDAAGFSSVASHYREHDWLSGREVTIETASGRMSGTGAGIADDGALLIDTETHGMQRVTSGTIVSAGKRQAAL